MRCRFCGCTSLHDDTQDKRFSTGKAVAGTIVFGLPGAAAGLIGKKVKGYRCSACGSFMETPMDAFTEVSIDTAIRNAESGRDRSSYDYYKGQYPNIQANLPVQGGAQVTPANIEIPLQIAQPSPDSEETIKRSYRYGLWQPDCPVYVEGIILKSTPTGDKLSLIAWNSSAKTIRSAYFQAKVLDDTGDVVSEVPFVYQGISVQPGMDGKLPENKEFDLKTDLAYKVELTCDKVAFEGDEVWRNEAGTVPFTIPVQSTIDATNFPRFKYITTKYIQAKGRNTTGVFMPLKEDCYWLCDCGQPVLIGQACPRCSDTWEDLEVAFSQKHLREVQQTAVKERAAKHVDELAYLVETAHKNKEREDNRLKNIQAIVAALKAGPSGQPQPNHNKLEDVRAKIQHLTDLLNGFDEMSAKSLSLQQEQTELEFKKVELVTQRAKLGLFAGKEKSRIDGEVSDLVKQITEIESQILQVEEKMGGYSAKKALEHDLLKEKATAASLEEENAQIEIRRNNDDYKYNFKDALAKYLAEPEMADAVNVLYPSARFVPAMYCNENSVKFGRYIQEPKGFPEPIEWQVLARENNRMLLISKYVLDCKAFDPNGNNKWVNCSLKKWMNGQFCNTMLTSSEQEAIIDTDVAVGKIFLLSIEEAREYFDNDIIRQCPPTAYVYEKTSIAYGGKAKGKFLWWLRSPGKINHATAFVAKSGSINTNGDLVSIGTYGVRPAIWISFDTEVK